MRSNYLKATLKAAIFAVTILLVTAGFASAQGVVNLTASQQTTVLPDGNTVPMWGWTCGTGVAAATGATCTALTYGTTGALNAQAGGTTWQPPLIVVPYVGAGTSLTINLTNTLPVETSLVIIGQSGGGLGAPVREAGPRIDGAHSPGVDHTGVLCTGIDSSGNPTPAGCNTNYGGPLPGQTATTWTIVVPGGFTPPTQGERARTFTSIEVPGVTTVGGTVALPGVYNYANLQPGTYLIRTGTYPSIQGPMGLYGVLVVTKAPVTGAPGLAYPVPAGQLVTGVTYDADVVALESEIDARQNKMVAALFPVGGAAGSSKANAGFSETAKWTLQCGAATNSLLTATGAIPTCYPPAVDYTPTYFAINGLAFSKDNRAASALSVPAAAITGNVLIRYVNAGSHMHTPTVDGLNMLLVAEDGFVLPDIALALTGGKTLTANNPPAAGQALGLRIQNEVFQAAGKVFDVIVSPPSASGSFVSATYPTWDRSLALGTNSQRDGGMQAILDVNDTGAGKVAAANSTAVANPDKYAYAPGVTLKVSDPGKGVIANDVNVYGVQVSTLPTSGTLTLYPNGTFTYVPTGANAVTATAGTDSFMYCANGATASATLCTKVTLNMSATATAANAPTANPDSYTSATASLMRVAAPGVLVNDTDPNSFPLTAVIGAPTGVTVNLAADGSFTAVPTTAGNCGPTAPCTFTYTAKNSQGISSTAATATLTFQPGSGLSVTVQDAKTKAAITDFKWIIEQDLTLHIDPACQVNTGTAARPLGCPPLPAGSIAPPTPATQFHASYSPVIASGCTGPQSCGQGQTVYDAGTPCVSGLPVGCSPTAGQHVQAACDGYGICTVSGTLPMSSPADANLTATNPDGTPASYYISILAGDSANAFNTANVSDPTIPGNCAPKTQPTGIDVASSCGHVMGGSPVPAPVASVFAPVTVNLEQNPIKTATVTAFIFEDDFPLNGEPDAGGGIDVLATNEPGLGDFQFEIWDTFGGIGDFTGQMTYDMFNVPLTNALNGTIDPSTKLDACPISKTAAGVGIGVIIVCPQFESDGTTLSPLTGQAVVRNLMQGKYSLIAHPGAAREAAGEEWLQTNSLDGGHFLDSFIRSGEPAYFQEYGPGGFHVFMGMANPKIINARLAAICAGTSTLNAPFARPCNNHVKGQVTNLHQSRSPNENLYSSAVFGQGNPGNYAPLAYTNCYAALGDSDGSTIALAKCDPDGNFNFDGVAGGLPAGNYGIVLFDQWDDFIVDGSSRPVNLSGGQTQNLVFPTFTWQTHLWSRAYMDTQGLGSPVLLPDGNLDPIRSPGLIQVPTRVRQRNGKFVNTLLSDITGFSRFDETFPLFAFYTVESDNTRFRNTGVHAVNDAGGQVDGPTAGGGNGNAGPYQGILNSKEAFPLPPSLQYPGSHYCAAADCPGGFASPTGNSTGRIDPGSVVVEGWQGGVGQFDMLDWGKTPYIAGENGGIRGHVVNGTTRPFDDPRMLFQNLWEPLVPNVTVNLYQEGTAPDGTTSLTLVDTTQTSSWDAWAQGFHTDPVNGVVPNMSCTGQDPVNDPFFSYTLAGTRNYLFPGTPLPNNSQYKCYDGYHNLNQLQPAAYDGLYQFPSQACLTGTTFTVPGNLTPYNCVTVFNPAFGQLGAAAKVLPPAKYVTEVVLPPNFELSKEEDLNLLIGDQYIAPAVAQFGGAGLGSIYITPDQASIDAANPSYTGPYTAGSPYNPPFGPCTTPSVASSCTFTPNTTNNGKQSTDYGRTTFGSFGPGGNIQQSAPCVGLMRIVPDYLSISPESGEVAPFAGSLRALCNRKEVTLEDTMQANADFFIYTKTPKATTFTGFISDDFSSEFDPAAPAFGEKFAIPNAPVSIKDFDGVEISRIYSDQWGTFNGMVYSTWEVDPPNPTGYAPNMMVTCMNDPGPIIDKRVGSATLGQLITDPFYTSAYSNFCYQNPFMPGDATYLDTPVVPTSAFAEGYNPPDCAYPDATPAIKSAIGNSGVAGPWVSGDSNGLPTPGSTLTITALGLQTVANNAYSGPAANTAPYNQKFITRNYHFGTAPGTVTIGGVLAPTAWGDTTLTVTVPAIPPAASTCKIQQRNRGVGVGPTRCGELVITTANTAAAGQPSNAKHSIDTVTVTVGGKRPTVLPAGSTIQSAIDAAAPGDMIIIPAGTYTEMLLMWKPVRLQGVGAASSVVNANTHPAGKLLEPWRRQVNCLFGLAINGGVSTGNNTGADPTTGNGIGGGANPFDPNYNGTAGSGFVCPMTMQQQVDRIRGESVVGWDASVNGNLAELLQEPSLMGAYEGAGITVLAKGVRCPVGTDCFGVQPEGSSPTEGGFPAGTVVLTADDEDCNVTTSPSTTGYVGNFLCNPSRIDGMSFTNSSQGGGGIWLHAWNHFMEIANNRVSNNGGTLTGGIVIGEPEAPDAENGHVDGTSLIEADGTEDPYLYNMNVHVHNNSVTSNASYGDELGSNTPASGGGVTFCTGADNYQFDYNWVCGNLSTGNGGGFAHFGFSYNGLIAHNSFLFNQSINPTLTTYGGGVVIQGKGPDLRVPDTRPGAAPGATTECGSINDVDCSPALSDGIGPGLMINANLFQGNTAEEGSGGGIEFQHVNGTDVERNPSNPDFWYLVQVENNIFVNNVAGWTGGGISLHDAVRVNFTNNTVVSNDTTASAGVLFDTLGAPNANQPPNGCAPSINPNCAGNQVTTSTPQPAGLATESHTANFLAAFTDPNVQCPGEHLQCTKFSNPMLHNDLFWQNRAFNIGAPGGIVQLHPILSQTVTGVCPIGATYWDIGVYTDTAPNNHASGLTMGPDWSVLTDAGDYPGGNNLGSNPNVASQYCDGSRVPPEIAPTLCKGTNGNANAPGCIQPGTFGLGTTVPGGIGDSLPVTPLFTLTPAATVDEGSNWINMFYGPLSQTCLITAGCGATPFGAALGNYALNGVAGSPAIDYVPMSVGHPTTDFFGNPRPDPSHQNAFDIGAIEFQGAVVASRPTLASIAPTSGARGNNVAVALTGTNLLNAQTLTVSGAGVTCSVTGSTATTLNATCAISANATLNPPGSGRTVTVTTVGGTSPANPAVTFRVVNPPNATLTSISPTSGARGTNVSVTLTGTNFTATGTTVTVTRVGGGAGVTVSGIAVNAAGTQLTATFAISPTTLVAGLRTVSVTNPSGVASAGVTFTVVNPPAPTLASIDPNTTSARGNIVTVVLTGTNFTNTGTTLNGFTGGVSLAPGTLVVVNSTTITATFNISATPTLGARNIRVTTPGGTSGTVTFTVQ